MVLQGKAGYSEKSPGNASFYYSYPRLTLTGTLTLDGEARQVTGQAFATILKDSTDNWGKVVANTAFEKR